jgi:hypothetical protein
MQILHQQYQTISFLTFLFSLQHSLHSSLQSHYEQQVSEFIEIKKIENITEKTNQKVQIKSKSIMFSKLSL